MGRIVSYGPHEKGARGQHRHLAARTTAPTSFASAPPRALRAHTCRLYYNKRSAIVADRPEEGTDVWAVNRGLISLIPLRLVVDGRPPMCYGLWP